MRWNRKGMVVCFVLFVAVLGLLALQSAMDRKGAGDAVYASEEELVSLTERSNGETKAATGEGVSLSATGTSRTGKGKEEKKETSAAKAAQTPSAKSADNEKAEKDGGETKENNKSDKNSESKSKSGKPKKSPQGNTSRKTPVQATPVSTPAAGTEQPAKTVVSFEIQCKAILDKKSLWRDGLEEIIPESGIFYEGQCAFSQGETVYDILKRICREQDIALDSSYTPIYGSYYVRGIGNLYEFDCGSESGWKYAINGVTPGEGSSQYTVQNHDRIVFFYGYES